MTIITKIQPPTRDSGFFDTSPPPTSDSNCCFSFNPDDVKKKDRVELQPHELNEDGHWKCPFPSMQNSEQCVFHAPIKEKSPSEVSSALLEYLSYSKPPTRRGIQIIGGKYDILDIRDCIHDLGQKAEIDLRYSTIESDIYFGDVHLPAIDLSGSTISGRIFMRDSTVDGDFNLSSTHFSNYGDVSLVLDGAIVNDNILIPDSNISGEVIFVDVNCIGDVDFQHSASQNGVDFFECHFQGEVKFYKSNILGEINAEDNTPLRVFNCDFDDIAHFQGVYLSGIFSGERSTFKDGLVLMHMEPSNTIKLSNVRIEGAATFEGMYIPGTSLYLRESEINGKLTIANTRFINSKNNNLDVHLERSNINSGDIFQSKGGDVYCFLEQATIGQVNFRHQAERVVLHPFPENIILQDSLGDESVFSYLSIYDTVFDGFDFGNYRRDLEKVNWNMHKFPRRQANREVSFATLEGEDEKVIGTVQADLSSAEILERTYLKARNGAKEEGDEIASSKFLIKEMRYRKLRYRNEFLTTLIFPDTLSDIRTGIINGSRWFLNSILEVSSYYGERVWPVLVYSVLLIIQSAMMYPLYGGFGNSSDTYSFSAVNEGTIALSDLVFQSLYFSFVTFTTVGYGDYTPNKGLPQLITAVESFFGALLLALIVFTFGKRVTR